MPELPEVETIRRSLLPAVTGRQICQVHIDSPAVFSAEAGRMITGRTIVDVRRRGKYLLFYLTGNNSESVWLLAHLRMTGRLMIHQPEEPPAKHTHVRIVLANADQEKSLLVFQDTRRFGRLWLSAASGDGQLPAELNRLGPEPLDPPVSAGILAGVLARHPGLTLKAALLNQSIIAGIGNIYADEILFAAGLAPQQRVVHLSAAQTEQLATAIPTVLARAIDMCGTTLRDYVDGWSRKGRFQACLAVYGRAGLPCRQCSQPLSKTRLAGRSTTWCPVCQAELSPQVQS